MRAAAVALAAVPLLLPSSAAAGPFVEGLTFPAGEEPVSIAAGQFDGGRDDLVVGGDGLWLLRGRAGGRLARPRLLERVFTRSVAVADVDGDSHDDVITGDTPGRRVLILYGDGRGGFPRRAEIPVSLEVTAVAEGGDLFVAGHVPEGETLRGELQVIDRDTLQPRSVISLPGQPLDLSVADVDGDGRHDAVVEPSGEKPLLFAGGEGPARPIQMCPTPAALRAAPGQVIAVCGRRIVRCPQGAGCATAGTLPVNGHTLLGGVDIVAGGVQWRDDTPYRAGLWRLRGGRLAFSRSIVPYALAAGDFDGDGPRDVAVLGGDRDRVQLLFARPARTGSALAGPRSRVLIRPQTVRVTPGFAGVRVRLACTRGRDGCHGELSIGRRGAPAYFDIRAGRTLAVPVSLTTTRFRRLDVRARVRWTAGRTSARLTVIGPTRADRRAACLPRDARILARTKYGTLFRRDGNFRVCAWSTGRHRFIRTVRGPIAMRGRWVAYGNGFCEDGCIKGIGLTDVHGRDAYPLLTEPDQQPACRRTDEFDVCADSVRRVVVNHRGGRAWLTCAARRDDPGDLIARCGRDRLAVAVVSLDSRGLKVLDRGRGLRRLRLSSDGRRLSWRNGSRVRTATLAGRARGAIGSGR